MTINLLTLFPEYFESTLSQSIIKRAISQNFIRINVLDIRKFATDKHRTTDDRPFGGGPGMVMKIEPIDLALESINAKKNQSNQKILLTSAKGVLFDQSKAQNLAKNESLTIICGHYEGVDERVAEHLVDEEIRIGDYVLTGGESAANVIIDAITRLIPGVLGNEMSNQNESHSVPGEFGHSQYTRPEIYKSWPVPSVLLSGDHEAIADWRRQQRQK